MALALTDIRIAQSGNGGAGGGEAVVSHHTDDIPRFAEDGLRRLYGHVHASLAFLETSRPLDGARTYVASQGSWPTAILVFRLDGPSAVVLNEMLFVGEEEVNRFASYVFRTFPSVTTIRFPALRTDLTGSPFPRQRYAAKEDWVINLPPTAAEYTARLSKKTREGIRAARNRIRRDFPSFTEQTCSGRDIGIDLVRDIVALSRTNIMAKKKMFGIDDDEIRRIHRLAQRIGVAHVLRIDGRICAGTICYTDGSGCLGEVIAHDPAYERYSLGTLCGYMTICASIERGERSFHMGGGRNQYKAKFLGVRQDMECLVMYRSYAHMALSPRCVARTVLDGWMRRAKIWLLEHEKSAVTRSVFNGLAALRAVARPFRRIHRPGRIGVAQHQTE